MKKMIAAVLLCALLLSGCGGRDKTPPVTESKTVYFVSFGLEDGRETALVRHVELIDGEFADTGREERFGFAKSAVFESFDLSLTAEPTEANIGQMELERFKAAALRVKDESPVIYTIQVAEGVIYSLRSELRFIPPEPEELLCERCGEWFTEGEEFDGHECLPEPTPSPTPTPAPTPVAAGTPGSLQCPVCAQFYAGDHDYLHHDCVDYSVLCPVCGAWFEPGYAFLSHPCAAAAAGVSSSVSQAAAAPTQSAAPVKLQCPVCANFYTEGSEYLYHQCVDYSVACPVCGGWYEAGYALLTHSCAAALSTPVPGVGGLETPAPDATAAPGASEMPSSPAPTAAPDPAPATPAPTAPPAASPVRCERCGKSFTPGREFDLHFCQYVPATCPKCLQSMPSWQLDSHDCPSANLQPRLCQGCGESFIGYAYDAHICPGNKINRVPCPICSVMFDEGAQLEAHMAGCTPTPVACEYCGTPIPGNVLAEHMMNCPANLTG